MELRNNAVGSVSPEVLNRSFEQLELLRQQERAVREQICGVLSKIQEETFHFGMGEGETCFFHNFEDKYTAFQCLDSVLEDYLSLMKRELEERNG